MQTVFETRRIRLGMLKKKFVRWSKMNEAIGWDKTSARLSQIYNETLRKDRGTPYVMGDPTAREIEIALNLPTGWFDTPPTYAELAGESDREAEMWLAMKDIPEHDWPTARRLLAALTKPAKNGTTGH